VKWLVIIGHVNRSFFFTQKEHDEYRWNVKNAPAKKNKNGSMLTVTPNVKIAADHRTERNRKCRVIGWGLCQSITFAFWFTTWMESTGIKWSIVTRRTGLKMSKKTLWHDFWLIPKPKSPSICSVHIATPSTDK